MYFNQYAGYNAYSNNANTNIIFVNGLEGARGYRISPQQTVLLVDSTQGNIYLKSTDNLGIETMKTYEIKEVTEEPKTDKVEVRLDALEKNIKEMIEAMKSEGFEIGEVKNESNNATNERKK